MLICARYLLPAADRPLIEDGAVLIAGDRIVAAGHRRDVMALAASNDSVDFGDALLLPPLVNAHTHLDLTAFSLWLESAGSRVAPLDYVDWIGQVVRFRQSVDADKVCAGIAAGIDSLLRAGTGAIGDILTLSAGLPLLLSSGLSGRVYAESIGLTAERYEPALAAALATAQGVRGRMRGGLSPHSPYTVSAAHLQSAVALSHRADLPLAIHAAETPEESCFVQKSAGPFAERLYPRAGWQEQLPAPAGLSPVAWLDNYGALTPQTLLIHGVQVDAADIGRIAASNASVVLCPRSNAFLDVGRAPAGLLRAAGVNLALGTDSLASNASLSLWDEIAFARRVYPELSPRNLLFAATAGGMHALGLDGGRLAFGLPADLQVLADVPAAHEIDEWLCSVPPVRALYLAGRERLASI